MPLIANDINNVRCISYDLPENTDIRQKWTCPNCKETMSFVNANTKIKHFRHFADSKCLHTEPESEEHISLKLSIYNDLKRKGYKCEYEVKIGHHIVDIVAVSPAGKKYAIECQVSIISSEEVLDRNKDYTEAGFNCLWILHTKNYAHLLRTASTKKGLRYATFDLKQIEREFKDADFIRYYIDKRPVKLQFRNKAKMGWKNWEEDGEGNWRPLEFYSRHHVLWLNDYNNFIVNKLIKEIRSIKNNQ